MFPRKERYPRADFPLALRGGKRVSSPHFSVVIPRSGVGYAVVIPKKVARLSVTRHTMKRRVSAALRTLPLPRAAIIFPHATVAHMRYDEIVHELSSLFTTLTHRPL